jgi:hypothetical protein
MSSVFSLVGGFALFIFSSLLLDGLRREEESAFRGWLLTMAIFTPWKILSWAFAGSLILIQSYVIFDFNQLLTVI